MMSFSPSIMPAALLATYGDPVWRDLLIFGGRAIYGALPYSYLFPEQGRIADSPVLAIIMLVVVAGTWFESPSARRRVPDIAFQRAVCVIT